MNSVQIRHPAHMTFLLAKKVNYRTYVPVPYLATALFNTLLLYFTPPGRDLDVHGAVYCRPQVQGADGRDDRNRHEHASLHLQGGQRGLRQRCHGARRYQHW